MPALARRAVLVLAAAVLAALPLRGAAQPGPPPPGNPGAPDTSRFLPRSLHPWLELGGSWLASPRWLHSHYEAGQAYAGGLEARPRRWLALRGALDYQGLVANRKIDYVVISATGADTLPYTYQTSAWSGLARVEAGLGLPWGLWVTGGGGGGFINTGFQGYDDYYVIGRVGNVPEAMRNGWGALWTSAARWDFQPSPSMPLGLEVRRTALRRGRDDVVLWSIRGCWRIPERPPVGAPPRR